MLSTVLQNEKFNKNVVQSVITAPPPPQQLVAPQQLMNNGTLMNNGARDVSNNDIQKLQQQLQDIKEQVSPQFCLI